MITDISQLDLNKTYSYADYLTWQFEQYVELIKGKIWKMSPAPRSMHQRVSWKIASKIDRYIDNKNCEAFAAPFDVRLYDKKRSEKASKDIFTVVQPDLCVICDNSKIDDFGCLGAPDLIVEILSPGNSKKEMRVKYELYEESGVREYWVADPERQTVQVFTLNENDKFETKKIFVSDDVMHSFIFEDLQIDLNQVFQNLV